jgi:chromosome segregation ATPase
MTKAQATFERINALVDGGMQKADAFKQLAEEYGQSTDSVRGAYYTAKRQAEGGTSSTRSRSRKRETTTEDAVASAVATLRGAIDSVEFELETARERAEEAQAEYEAMKAASGDRIKEIRAKIAVLDPTATDEPAKLRTVGSGAKAPDAKPATPPKKAKGS